MLILQGNLALGECLRNRGLQVRILSGVFVKYQANRWQNDYLTAGQSALFESLKSGKVPDFLFQERSDYESPFLPQAF